MKTFIIIFFSFLGLILMSQDYSKNRIPCEPIVYPIQFYYIRNHPLKGQRNTDFLYQVKDTLNSYFYKVCIQFQICKIDTIEDYNYLGLGNEPYTDEYWDVRAMYYNPKAINIYWANTTSPNNINSTHLGLCASKKDRPYVFLTQTSFESPNLTDICVLLYRYFGLYFTDSYTGSVEFVNGTNGKITADSIWDTPADPGTLVNVGSNSFALPEPPPFRSYLYTDMKDPNGDYYNPMVLNPMSIWSSKLKKPILTHVQYYQIVANERRCRKKFWELDKE